MPIRRWIARRKPHAVSSSGMEDIRSSIEVDQKPIGRRPRSNLATYTGLFDHVRKLFAAMIGARVLAEAAGDAPWVAALKQAVINAASHDPG